MTNSKGWDFRDPDIPNVVGPFADWHDFESVWLCSQVALPLVQRWKKYDKDDEHGGVRRQDSLQHSHSIRTLGEIFLELRKDVTLSGFKRGVELDESLILRALSIHDEGEGVIGHDTLYIDKTVTKDLEEYNGFLSVYSQLPAPVFERFQDAFLLQFALKCPEEFPEDARWRMGKLADKKRYECHAFDAIERWDYLMYAIEQYKHRGNKRNFLHVIRGQAPELTRLSEIVGLNFNFIWTSQMRDFCDSFIASHEGLWIEQKGKR